ncbi:MAG: ribose-5-phosphate isomerase RpiA [Candidatus Hydrothermarchaeaceae archaeon]
MNSMERAAASSVALVKDGQVVGLGTGSTAQYALIELARRIEEEGLQLVGIPTSVVTEKAAKELGIPLSSLEEHEVVDIDIDGADQVSRRCDLIKGGGGAHFREKMVALASKRFIVMVDEGKMSEKLEMSVPVEVLPFSWRHADKRLSEIGGKASLRRRDRKPFVTDNGNYILNVDFGVIDEPRELEVDINSVPGVLENGIFAGMECEVHVGSKKGVRIIKP